MCVCVCVCVCVTWEMLDVFGGLTKVTIYSDYMILLKTEVVLTSLILGLRDTGLQNIWLLHKQLKSTK